MESLSRRVARRSVDVLTVAVGALAMYVLLQPDSVLHAKWASYRDARYTSAAVQRLWPELTRGRALLSTTEGAPEIVEVSDYTWAFCRRASPTVDSAVAKGARIAYLHLPHPARVNAEGAARAAICAEAVGRFPQMHARLMATSAWQADSNWSREAAAAGVEDLTGFTHCMQSPAVSERLRRERALAESLKVMGTPMFFTRGRHHRGAPTLAELLALSGDRR